jgi:hypothetical protein
LFVLMFAGMALGSAASSLLFAQWGWTAVIALATVSALGALAIRLWPAGRRNVVESVLSRSS